MSVARFPIRWWLVVPILGFVASAAAGQGHAQGLDSARTFLRTYCAECHTGQDASGDVHLTPLLEEPSADHQNKWERVYRVVRSGRMPPPDAEQPTNNQRNAMLTQLRPVLTPLAVLGTTQPRRLKRAELEQTLRQLFHYPDYVLPDAFPLDAEPDHLREDHGYVVSPPLLAAYLDVATFFADDLFPAPAPPKRAIPQRYEIPIDQFTNQRDAGAKPGEQEFRLVSSKNMANSAAWPSTFEAPESGIYRLTATVRAFQTDHMFYPRRASPFEMGVYARGKTDQVYAPFQEVTKLGTFAIPADGKPAMRSLELELHRGQIFGLRWENGPCFSDPPGREYARAFYDDRLQRNRAHYAAMLTLRGGPRGMTQQEYYRKTEELMQSGQLDLKDPRLDALPDSYGGGLGNTPHRWISRYVHEEMFRYGPAADIVAVQLEGPLRLVEDLATQAQQQRRSAVLGAHADGIDTRQDAVRVLRKLLTRAFRRPVNEELFDVYLELVEQHAGPKKDWEAGLHVGLRRALVSPHFLFRSLRPGQLDSYDLATRLSYFLTLAPPDGALLQAAAEGQLKNPEDVRAEAERLLQDPAHLRFLTTFVGQWLGTDRLQDIMPDPRLLKFFANDRAALIEEAELFVEEMLRENHRLERFIDPGFGYRNRQLNKIYGGERDHKEMRRETFARGGQQGGILSLAAVMMATANGVDTHPVHRGVWVLENVLGRPTPPPPDNVPAIAPDTSGTHTIADQLAAHRADSSCATCHQHIDPLGMVLENFDPVGRWREHYPRYVVPADGQKKLEKEFYATIGQGTKQGPAVFSHGDMPDGRTLKNIVDLKAYVLEHRHDFARCLAAKLLVHATGRPLSFGDELVLDDLTARVAEKGNGFRDLVLAIVSSVPFSTK